jgi:hypothetical protein
VPPHWEYMEAEHDGTDEAVDVVEVADFVVVAVEVEVDFVLDGAGEPPPPYTAGPGMV